MFLPEERGGELSKPFRNGSAVNEGLEIGCWLHRLATRLGPFRVGFAILERKFVFRQGRFQNYLKNVEQELIGELADITWLGY
jgi:hypothetical protein